MNFGKLAHKVLKKNWTEDDVADMVGDYQKAYIGYAEKESIQIEGASGGISTAILSYALTENIITGALVCRTKIHENKVRPEFYIATNQNELIQSQDSKYVETNFASDALQLIDSYQGRLAVVGLPCDLKILKAKIEKDPKLAKKIVFSIGLLCGHNSRHELIDEIITKLKPNPKSKLSSYRFRKGHWRGYSVACFDDDIIIKKKSSYYNLYQNLFFFCQKKCLFCHDHFAYYADISVGDIWSYHLKNHTIKHNSLIARTKKGFDILRAAHQSKSIHLDQVQIHEILDGQARGAPTHNNTSAKSAAGKRFGLKIADRHKKKIKIRHFIVAWLIMFNYTWSVNKKYARYIFKIPRKIMKLYLLLFKMLESLK